MSKVIFYGTLTDGRTGRQSKYADKSLYDCWVDMKQRCYNPKNRGYKNYGYRGIKVCDRWLESYQNFYDDMAPKPSDKHSLDRINNDGDYSPDNCRWATQKEQVANSRRHQLQIKKEWWERSP